MWYHVINCYQGRYSNEGTYKHHDSAERRADGVQGGETSVFGTFTSDPKEAIQEFRDEEIKRL